MLETHFQAAMAATSAPPPPPATSGPNSTPPSTAAAHASVVSSALGALSTWVEWTPLARIAASNVIDAASFFLSTPEFRLDALDVLKQVRSCVCS